MTALLDRLRPHPHRGDVVAAGAVPLALVAVVIELRMRQWSLGARFVVIALLAGLVLAMGWLAELERDTPRPYHSVLLVAGLLPLIVALQLLAEVLGAHRPPGAGGLFWTFACEALLAGAAARRANSGVCTLIAALAAAVATEAFVSWVFQPHGLGTFRAILLLLTLVFAAGAVRLRDRRRRHAVALVNAGGILAAALALTFLVTTLVASAAARFAGGSLGGAAATAPFGWKLYLLAAGFGSIAYAAADREPGPAYIGTAVLAAFAVLVGLQVSDRGSLVGWPLFLLVLGCAGLAVGLRPRRPLPPPPDAARTEVAPTVPLERVHDPEAALSPDPESPA
jgi:hypothetical protein